MLTACLMFLALSANAQVSGFELSGVNWTCKDGDAILSGVIYKPDGEGPFPAILISHGKGGSAASMGGNFAKTLTKKGLVCIAVEYTHARSGDGKDPGASKENIRRALKTLEIARSLKYVDPDRVAAFGHSMGGFLTIGLAAESSAKLKAAIISAGGIVSVSGFAAPDSTVAKAIKVPTLILHGDKDNVVPASRSESLKSVLDENKVPCLRHVYVGEGHNIIHSQYDDMVDRIANWLVLHGVLKK